MEILHNLALGSMVLGVLCAWGCVALGVWWLWIDRPGRDPRSTRFGAWIRADLRKPLNEDYVLAVVSGSPARDVHLEGAYLLALYTPDCGWIVEPYEDWEDPEVTWWAPLPAAPEKGGDGHGTR